jgi:hypothetical protein
MKIEKINIDLICLKGKATCRIYDMTPEKPVLGWGEGI